MLAPLLVMLAASLVVGAWLGWPVVSIAAAALLCTAAGVFGNRFGMADGFGTALFYTSRELMRDAERVAHAADLERARRAELEAECDLALDLPPRPKHERYVYVLGFSTGAVKVGQTFDPARRIREHRRDAAAFNVNLVSFWVSPAHKNYLANEAELIAGCLAISPSVRKEYFPNLAYADAIKVARGLTFYSADLSGRSIRGGRQ
jgi:hypothetical protein